MKHELKIQIEITEPDKVSVQQYTDMIEEL